jgi:hypothetical protein
MVLWCKECGALVGLREPVTDWTTDRNGVCTLCLCKQADSARLPASGDTAEIAAFADTAEIPVPPKPDTDASPPP